VISCWRVLTFLEQEASPSGKLPDGCAGGECLGGDLDSGESHITYGVKEIEIREKRPTGRECNKKQL